MQVFVDELTCIGCGKCVRWAPNTFEIEASKYGRARVIDQQGNDTETIAVAIEVCPVDCIHFVTVPQLVLLEATLSTMDRYAPNHMHVGNHVIYVICITSSGHWIIFYAMCSLTESRCATCNVFRGRQEMSSR